MGISLICYDLMISITYLVVSTILKNMISSVGKDYPIYEMENKKCLKPPTRLSTYNPIDNVGT